MTPKPARPWWRTLRRYGLFFIALIVLEDIPRRIIGTAAGGSFDKHPLGPVYNHLVVAFNVLLVLIIVLINSTGIMRRSLPAFYTFSMGMILFLIASALYLGLIERQSQFAFQMIMLHMLAGRFAMPFTLVYVVHHLMLWWPGSSPGQRRAGKLLVALFIFSFGLGTVFSILGGAEIRGAIVIHQYASWLFVAGLVWHITAERRRHAVTPNPSAAPIPTGARYVFGRRQRGWAVVWSLVPLAFASALSRQMIHIPRDVSMMLKLLENTSTDLPTYKPVDAAYALPYGAEPFRPARTDLATGGLPEQRFVQQGAGCGTLGCHADIARNWAVSTHRHSKNVVVDKVVDALVQERGMPAARYCAGCHDPVNLLTGQIDSKGQQLAGRANEGVTCIVCHTTAHVGVSPGNGSYTLVRSPNFFERQVHESDYLAIVVLFDDHSHEFLRPLYKQSEFCASCHDHTQPPEINPHGLIVSSKLEEWRASPYADPKSKVGFKSCQDCHMPPVMESFRQREVSSHRWLASNTGLASYYAKADKSWDEYATRNAGKSVTDLNFTHEEQLGMELKNLQQGILKLAASWGAASPGPDGATKLPVTLDITNVGVGHTFPSGPFDLLDVWLDLEVTGPSGRIWATGQLDPAGHVPPTTVHYGADYYDDHGVRLVHHEIWKAAEIRNDRRIASGATDHAHFDLLLPPGAKGPLSLRVRVRHRRWNPDFANWAIGPGAADKEPITDILDEKVPVPWSGG